MVLLLRARCNLSVSCAVYEKEGNVITELSTVLL